MIYALNLSDDGRVLSVTLDRFAPSDQPRVDTLPDGDVSNYRYADGVYIYDPLPEPEQPSDPQPTQLDRIEAQALYTALMTDTILEEV